VREGRYAGGAERRRDEGERKRKRILETYGG
jgi:hypothetical protein